MKKEELKKEFEEKLKNITVSSNLRERTLNNIYSKNNVYRLPYWIKNCAAVFVVTCLCLSIYVVNNKNIFNKENDTHDSIELHTENYMLKSINDESLMLESSMSSFEMKSTTLDTSNNYSNDIDSSDLFTPEFSLKRSAPITSNSFTECIKEPIPTEEEFLTDNPDAIKTEIGYMIIKDDTEIYYELKDGFIYEIIN